MAAAGTLGAAKLGRGGDADGAAIHGRDENTGGGQERPLTGTLWEAVKPLLAEKRAATGTKRKK